MSRFLQVAFAASVILASTSAIAVPKMNKPLRVCADPGNMPYSNTKGEGFENKIADVLAEALGTQVTYFYRPYLERGLTRQTFKNEVCDVLMDMSPDNEMMITTTPLYRSTFVLVSRKDRNYHFKSLDDPRLKELTVGVFQHSTIRTELMEHGVNGENLRLHIISHDADLHPEEQPTHQIKDVVDGKLDVAGAWGPIAGWYNTKKVKGGAERPLEFLMLNSIDTVLPMEFDLSIGMKRRDKKLQAMLNKVLVDKKDDIKQILLDYGVPLVECNHCLVSGNLPSHGPYKKQEVVVAKFQPTKQSDPAKLSTVVDAALAAGSTLNDELIDAVLMKDFTKVDYVIKQGANIDARDNQQLTPLMLAVKGGNYDLVRALLKYGADFDAVDEDGWSAVMHAAWNNEPKMIRTISAYGANLELVEKLTHSTALGLAATKGQPLALVALLDSGAKPNSKNGKAGYTALMIVAKIGSLPAAQVLTQYGAEVNVQNAGGVTALMIAAANDHMKMVALLVKAGADTSLKDANGQTALDLAKQSEAMKSVNYLTKKLAN